MKHTHYILIGITLCLQILFANTTLAQITAEYNADENGITVSNKTQNKIYVFQFNEDIKQLKNSGRSYCGISINDNKIKSTIKGCDFLEIKKGNKEVIIINAGESQSIRFKESNKSKPTSFTCYEGINGEISKEYPITINKPKPKNEDPPKTEPKPEPQEPQSEPKIEPKAEPKPEPKKEPKKETKPSVQKEDIIQTYRTEYQTLYAACSPVLAKGKWNVAKEEKQCLDDCQKQCRLLKEKIEKVPSPTQKHKDEKKKLISEINNLCNQISEILISADIKKIQDEYDTEIIRPQNEILARLQNEKSEIDLAVQQINEKSELLRWQDKDSLLEKLQLIKNQVEQQRDLFYKKHQEYMILLQDKENEKMEILEEFVSEQREPIVNEYEDMYYRIQEYETRINKIEIPYSKYILFGTVFLLILAASVFYTIARLRKKSLRKQAQKKLEHNIRPIEEPQKTNTNQNYAVEMSEIKEQAGQDYYPINMNEIFDDTAIQTVYIKRKCISDIYRFFSEFLKLSGKTNEIGCFIVGQWEYASPKKNTYNISIEEIIEPGADVVYGEYELDFGAEIGVGLEGLILSLRQKTGKEYVHTAWMHSHPGLGIFLSNHDLNVQAQLAYPEHKNRMLAIVIDSNTEELSMAFFTPKKDGSMNNKEELKKELSLELLYQWVKRSYSNIPEKQIVPDYYECTSNNQNSKIESVFFNGTAIIEMDHAIMPDAAGLTGYFFGKSTPQSDKNKDWVFVENFQAVNTEKNTDLEPIGCLLIVPEYSYQNIIHKYYPIINRYSFFAVYQPKSDFLRLITKEKNNKFSETDADMLFLTLMDMKKWTRRKRN